MTISEMDGVLYTPRGRLLRSYVRWFKKSNVANQWRAMSCGFDINLSVKEGRKNIGTKNRRLSWQAFTFLFIRDL